MDRLEYFLSILDNALDTDRKHHLISVTLMSLSLLFGGLAITIFTLKMEDEDDGR